MKQFIFSAAILISACSFAQDNGTNPGNVPLQILTRENVDIYKTEGSPYYEDQYVAGILKDTDGKSQPAFFRYNVSEDKIEIKLTPNREDTYFLPRYERYQYQLKNYTYQVGKYKLANGGMLEGYFMNYYDGDNVKFLGKPVANVSVGQEAKTGYEKAKPSRIYINQIYYLQLNDGDLHEVRLKEKDFEELLGDKPEVKSYLKAHKIKEVSDVKELLAFYDKL